MWMVNRVSVLAAIVSVGLLSPARRPPAAPSVPPVSLPTEAAQAQIQALLSAAAAKIKAVLDEDPKLREALRTELEAIRRIASPQARAAAITAFQSKYADAYARVLTRAGVDLSLLAAQLNGLMPGFRFRAVPKRHYISATAVVVPTRALTPLPVRRTTAITAFESENASECGVVRQTALSDGISLETEAGSFSSCHVVTTRSARFDVPNVREASIQTPYGASVVADAGTIGFTSGSITVTSAAVCPSGSLYTPAFDRFIPCQGDQIELFRIVASVFVLGFWSATEEAGDARSPASIGLPVNRAGMRFAVNGYSWNSPGTLGWAKGRVSNQGYAVTLQTTDELR